MIRILSAFVLCLALAQPSNAQPTPAGVVAADFLPGWRMADGTHVAGLRLTLAPGWKTYWRMPGESGIPPRFDWTGSRNLRDVRVHWPHPDVFDDYGLQTIGYRKEVILPVTIVPVDGKADLVVRGQASIGVCKDVCLPVEIGFAATLPAGGTESADAGAIRAALARTPTDTPLRGAASCRVTPIADGLRLTAEMAVAPLGGVERVFMETGRADVWVSQAEVSRVGSTLVASADLVPADAQPFALDRSTLRMTVLGRDGSVELAGCTAG